MGKFCKRCGAQLREGAEVCGNCGNIVNKDNDRVEYSKNLAGNYNVIDAQFEEENDMSVSSVNADKEETSTERTTIINNDNIENANNIANHGQNGYESRPLPSAGDTGSIAWGILGFFIPFVGIILYFVWRKSSPKNAKKAGLGALVNIIFNFIFYFILLIVESIF